MRADQQRVRSLLAEAITILCKNTLSYTDEFCVEGLLGITLDNNEVFLVNIKENVRDHGTQNNDQSSVPPHLGMLPTEMAPPQARPSPRAMPTSRPIPARSPFLPRRPTFGNRGRGRGRGKHPIRPPSRITSEGAPPAKRANMETPTVVAPENVVEVNDEENADQDMKPTDLENETQQPATDNQQHDPLTALDFGDMMQQYEDTAPSIHDSGTGNTIDQGHGNGNNSQDLKSSDTSPPADANGAIVIKPDPEKDIPQSSCSQDSSGGNTMFATPVDHSDLFAATHSGPVFPGAMPPSPQFMDTAPMPGFSGWGQQSTPTMPTPKRSGPGRPSAASGSPSQGSPGSQDVVDYVRTVCPYCKGRFSKLKRHIDTIHIRGPEHAKQCPICFAIFYRREHLKRHITNIHKVPVSILKI